MNHPETPQKVEAGEGCWRQDDDGRKAREACLHMMMFMTMMTTIVMMRLVKMSRMMKMGSMMGIIVAKFLSSLLLSHVIRVSEP